MLISSTTLKSSKFSSPLQRQVNFACPRHEDHFNFDQTLNQLIFDPLTKPSQLWSLHWSYVNSDPPHRNHVHFDHPHNNQVNFDANTKTMSFSGAVNLGVIHISNKAYNIMTSTNSYYSWRFHTTVKPRKYCVSMYHILFLLHGTYTARCGTGDRYVLFLLYVVLFTVKYRL